MQEWHHARKASHAFAIEAKMRGEGRAQVESTVCWHNADSDDDVEHHVTGELVRPNAWFVVDRQICKALVRENLLPGMGISLQYCPRARTEGLVVVGET